MIQEVPSPQAQPLQSQMSHPIFEAGRSRPRQRQGLIGVASMLSLGGDRITAFRYRVARSLWTLDRDPLQFGELLKPGYAS